MNIHQVRAIEGANFFSYRPVIRGVIDISQWQGKTTKEMGDFNERLLKSMPTLSTHSCSRGKAGGFIERLQEGTLPGHVLEHIAIELLTLAGEKTRYGKTRLLDEKRHEYEVIYQYECKEAGLEAFYLAGEVLNQLYGEQSPEIPPMVEKLKSLRLKYMPGPSASAILEACRQKGIPVQRLNDGSVYQLGYGRFARKIQAAMTDQTSCIGVDIASDKQLTRKILSEAAIPVPWGKVVETEDDVLEVFREFKQRVVIKPQQGNQGKGVSLNLDNEQDILAAFRLAEVYESKVIMEEYVEGNNYRLLVVGGKMVAAARRIPPHVIGDGKSTIKELVEKENSQELRGKGHENYLTKIAIDAVVVMDLHRQKLSLASIPAQGEEVILRQSANLSTGSTAIDVTDIVHPDNARLAVYAAKILGMDIAGIDFIVEDISASYLKQRGKIIEVNAAPGLRMHLRPSRGVPRDIGGEITKMLFPQGNGRVPVVSVTGTNGKTTTVRLLSNMLQKQNLTVGMTSTEGIYINQQLLCQGDLSGPKSAQVVLRHPEVQVAVLETARGGILRAGLGYDYADIAIITNISEDHLGDYGIEDIQDLTKVKSLVAEVVQKESYVILNADDPLVASIAKKTKGRIIFFSQELNNKRVCKHLGMGGTAVIVNKGRIMVCSGVKSSTICHLSKIPLTWGGKASHNVQNVLAAVAGCWALGYAPTQIRKAICGYGLKPKDNWGRLECYELDGIKVVLDYGHNPAGIKETIQTLRKIKHRKLIGCVGLPGDRSDITIKNFAKEAAKGFDYLYFKEDSDLRGRKAGEVAQMLYNQALAEGKPVSSLEIILAETQALEEAIKIAHAGDIVVVFFEKAEPLRQIIKDKILRINEVMNSPENSDYNISLEV